VAPRTDEAARFRRSGSVANPFATDHENGSDKASRTVGTIVAASLCVHLLFCFAGLTLMGNASMLNGWRQFTLLSMTFTAMLITAKIFSKSEAKNERQGQAQISSGSDPALCNKLGGGERAAAI